MIHIFETYYLDSDPRNYILLDWNGSVQKDKSTGKIKNVYQRQTYYSDFGALFTALAKHMTRKAMPELETLEGLKTAIEEVNAKITRAMERLTVTMVREALPEGEEGVPDEET